MKCLVTFLIPTLRNAPNPKPVRPCWRLWKLFFSCFSLSCDKMSHLKTCFFCRTDLCCCFSPTGALGFWFTWCSLASHLFWEKKSRKPSWMCPRSMWTTLRMSFRASLTSLWISSSPCSSKTLGRNSWLLFVNVEVKWHCDALVLFWQAYITWLMEWVQLALLQTCNLTLQSLIKM